MYKIYLKQAWALLKENKLLSGVSIFGTALAICMIMVIVIVWQVRTANYSPEDNRDRTLYVISAGANSIENPEINNISKLGTRVAKECVYPLRQAEAVGFANHGYQALVAVTDHTVEFKGDVSYTDAGFWSVFNFRFLAGKPYGEEVVESGIRDAVVSESVARKLYGTTDVVGRTVELSYTLYTIRGVVEDVSILAEDAYADVWVPYTSNGTLWDNVCERLIGSYQAYILAASTDDLPRLKEELQTNVERMNASQREYRLNLGGAPDTIMERLTREGVMNEPDVRTAVLRYLLIIAVALLIPAINMSGLALSRMRRRISEIGVRRAFGATRNELIGQILYENLLQTLLGGVLGLVLSYLVIVTLPGWLLPVGEAGVSQVFLNADMLFNPMVFLLAFAACLLLNLLSVGVPAWRSTKTPIVDALNEY
ncbi:ABC transporter permease [uncultured Parabacteroides sp.]|uniref:ABC transporter permease n=1 Tax=uncultured Parabacteroides sp. TaxID=512312 RepID=UPI002638614C|nr:ABC transporter permease [uncultured Parabacteroides sp.]